MPFFASTVKPTSLVMMMLPGIAEGQKPSVNASVSESVAGSISHDGALLSVVAAGAVTAGVAVVGGAMGNTITGFEAGLGRESAYTPSLFPTVVNVYDIPLVSPLMVHEPAVPVTVHVAPPGDAVIRKERGDGDPGFATVIVALSIPASTVGALGVLTATTLFRTECGPNDAASAPVGL